MVVEHLLLQEKNSITIASSNLSNRWRHRIQAL